MDCSWSSYWVASFNWSDMSCYDRLCCLRRTCPCSTVVASLLDLVKVSERFIVSALLRSRLARDHKSRAVTYVLSGGFFAAFLGPTIANRGKNLFETDYLGSFVIIAFFWSSSPSRQRHMKKDKLLVICLKIRKRALRPWYPPPVKICVLPIKSLRSPYLSFRAQWPH